ncbi:MAG: CAAX amino terminal protease self- immunity [Candidatus Izimaplasma bacterium HR2]|nr:MAG: CAAX amino terminal protease self- immunity [Candidatus Izimaplasma bacterium HR2]
MTNTNKEGLNIIIFYIVMWIAVIILQFIMIYMNLEPSGEVVITDAEELRMISVTNLVLYLSLFIIFLYTLRSYLKNQIIETRKNFLAFIRVTTLGLLGLFIAVYASAYVMEYLGITANSENQEVLNRLIDAALFDKIALVLFSVFLAPFVEEIVFRRAVYGFLENVSIPLAIIVSGLSFGFIHVLSGDFIQIIIYGSLGLVLALMYYLSKKNIMTVIAIHMVYNLIITVFMFT